MDLWYSRVGVQEIVEQAAAVGTPKQLKRAEKNVAKARSRDSLKRSTSWTETVDGQPRIRNDPPVIVPIHEPFAAEQHAQLNEALREVLRCHRSTLPRDRRHVLERFRYADTARNVVGVGSVGTRAWIMLLLGRDDGDPLFVQLNEAEASVLEPFLGASEFDNHGQRVVEGQRLTQGASDIDARAGCARATSTGSPATSTSASCGTRRDRRSSSS